MEAFRDLQIQNLSVASIIYYCANLSASTAQLHGLYNGGLGFRV